MLFLLRSWIHLTHKSWKTVILSSHSMALSHTMTFPPLAKPKTCSYFIRNCTPHTIPSKILRGYPCYYGTTFRRCGFSAYPRFYCKFQSLYIAELHLEVPLSKVLTSGSFPFQSLLSRNYISKIGKH